jgi:ribosomal RNA-processing protein 1
VVRTKYDSLLCSLIHCFNSPNDIRVPTSLAYHVADIYIEELDKALGSTQEPLPAPLAVLLGPFFTLAAQTPNSTTYKRVQSAVIEPLLSSLSPESLLVDGVEPPKPKKRRLREETCLAKNACFASTSEGKVNGLELRKMLLRRIFVIASELTTRESNRRKMYAFWKENCDDPEET